MSKVSVAVAKGPARAARKRPDREIPKIRLAPGWTQPDEVIVGPEGMVTAWVFITPAMALEAAGTMPAGCLAVQRDAAGDPINRKRRIGSVNAYQRDMSQGAWKPHHQGIAFDVLGQLRDGQHRLEAIFDSGQGQWLQVTWNLPVETISNIDEGLLRTAEDAINLAGGTTNRKEIGIARRLRQRDGQFTMTIPELEAFMQTYQGGIAFATWALSGRVQATRHVASAGVGAAIAAAWYHVSEPRLQRFCELLIDGMYRAGDGPEHRSVLALRDMLIGAQGAGKRPGEIFAKVLRMVRAYAAGDVLDRTHPSPNVTNTYLLPEPADAATRTFTPPV